MPDKYCRKKIIPLAVRMCDFHLAGDGSLQADQTETDMSLVTVWPCLINSSISRVSADIISKSSHFTV